MLVYGGNNCLHYYLFLCFDHSASYYRRVGYRLAKGESLEAILSSMDGVSEGVFTVLALEQLIKTKVRPNVYEFKFPIMAGVAQIIRGNITPRFGLNLLMRYPIRDESRGLLSPAVTTKAVAP